MWLLKHLKLQLWLACDFCWTALGYCLAEFWKTPIVLPLPGVLTWLALCLQKPRAGTFSYTTHPPAPHSEFPDERDSFWLSPLCGFCLPTAQHPELALTYLRGGIPRLARPPTSSASGPSRFVVTP